MPVPLKLALFVVAVIGGEFVILFRLDGTPGWLGLEYAFAMLLASAYVSCRTCGKSVFTRAGSTSMLGAMRPWPERVCSKCGAVHFGQRGES